MKRLAGRTKRKTNFLAISKEGEQYIFLYDDQSYRVLLGRLGRFAADPELSFTWFDAATLMSAAMRLRNEK